MKISRLSLLMMVAYTSLLVSCDKVSDLISEFKDGKEVTVSHEDIVKSDAAVMKYITALEELPSILAKVRDDKTAFEARKQIDELSKEVSVIVVDLVQIEGDEVKKMLKTRATAVSSKAKGSEASKVPAVPQKRLAPDVEAEIYWYTLEENADEYEARVKKLGTRVGSQLIRIATITQESAIALDVVLGGIITLASVEAGGEVPSENPVDVVKPMPKDWLPSGVTRE